MSKPDHPCEPGSIRAAFGPNRDHSVIPVVQILKIKPTPGVGGQPDRYRIVFSDTLNFIQAMLATQANNLVSDNIIERGCFIRLTQYQENQVKDKRILIVLNVEVLKEYAPRDRVGNPLSLDVDPSAAVIPPQFSKKSQQPNSSGSSSFYGNKPSAPPQPVQRSAPKSAIRAVGPSGHDTIYPIESLSPYHSNWTIRARVSQKSDIKTWSNQRGEGKLFTVTFLDESGEIRATGFKDQCDQLYDVLQEGQVYYVSKCRVTMAKRQFSNVNNDYELTFERETVIEKCESQDESVPQVRFNFVSLADLNNVEKDAMIDVIGILKEVGDTSEIISRATQKPYAKRELVLVDSTNFSVRLTVWGKAAETWDVPVESVLAFKGVKVGDYGGRSLSTLSSSSMTADPDIDEAHRLKGWFDGQGRGETFSNHQSMGGPVGAATGRKEVYKTLVQIKEENLGMGDNPDYFTTKATITYIKKENVSYPACLSEGCNRKVVEIADGQWRCEKCGKTHSKPQHRYILAISCNDAFGQGWLNCFDDIGRLIIGRSADELYEVKCEDEQAFLDVLAKAICKTYVFGCRAKMDNYQDQQRVRYQIMSATTPNYAFEAARLVEQIKLYNLD
ncbi:Replication factor A protein 1 [Rhizina undulata]